MAPREVIFERMSSALYARARFHLRQLAGSRQPRVVFLHVPKCAGTTINHHFKSNFGGAHSGRSVTLDSYIGNARDPETLALASTAQFAAGHFGWTAFEAIANGAFAFTVLRDPIARLQALYNFARKPRDIRHPAFAKLAQAASVLDFRSFCLAEAEDIRAYVDNAITRTLARDYFPFARATDADVYAAISNLSHFDRVIDAKHLNGALPDLARTTGTTMIDRCDWLNRTESKRQMWRDDFLADPRLRAKVSCDLAVYDAAMQGRNLISRP